MLIAVFTFIPPKKAKGIYKRGGSTEEKTAQDEDVQEHPCRIYCVCDDLFLFSHFEYDRAIRVLAS